MEEEQRERKLPPYRKIASDLLGNTRAKGMEAFSTRLFEYEMTLIALLLAELEEAEPEVRGGETFRPPSCRSTDGALAEARVQARYQEALADHLSNRMRLKAALKQILGSREPLCSPETRSMTGGNVSEISGSNKRRGLACRPLRRLPPQER